ncbi:hypothetical protein Cob_v012194 [Colletotrichum orbiculare MAFF 240422]|uniref:Uncharacterized protein n=1 Tax=Colletotrichum orbiculare (strain 104-T / ATCC 96160 / CBS 514.97 / LARS 414 / MAFF 240422) TaxID=1213857 RepID=A0A484FA07_COLOR|nr:hypothetical protein Cob_v012194 [Colletotrichum orbiculare MAFF 240422]
MQITQSSILRSLRGVTQATKSSDESVAPVLSLLSSPSNGLSEENEAEAYDPATGLSFKRWISLIQTNTPNLDETSLHIAYLSLATSLLRDTGRQNKAASPPDLAQAWTIIHDALTSKTLARPLFTASRSAQGLLSVPLCSLVKDGCIDELLRLHVWMPDGKRANPDFALHSHQAFAQSWILAGQGIDHAYQVDEVRDVADATHAGYALAWNDGKGQTATYKTHQSCSIVKNTGRLFRAEEVLTEKHVRDSTYTVPPAAFHATEVAPDALHATLFYFDASRGFVKDAGVLGPRDGESYTQFRDPAGVTPCELGEAVESIRARELDGNGPGAVQSLL